MKFNSSKFNSSKWNSSKSKKIENGYEFDKAGLWDYLEVAKDKNENENENDIIAVVIYYELSYRWSLYIVKFYLSYLFLLSSL